MHTFLSAIFGCFSVGFVPQSQDGMEAQLDTNLETWKHGTQPNRTEIPRLTRHNYIFMDKFLFVQHDDDDDVAAITDYDDGLICS